LTKFSQAISLTTSRACVSGLSRKRRSILIGKPEEKTSFVRQWHKREDNNMDLEVIKLKGMDCIHVVQGMGHCQALGNRVTNLWVLLKVRNLLSS
jgi:hypothetical protein